MTHDNFTLMLQLARRAQPSVCMADWSFHMVADQEVAGWGPTAPWEGM